MNEVAEVPKTPEPIAIGSDQVQILKHDMYRKGGEEDITETIGIELVARNATDGVIGSVSFEAILYDEKGNALDKIENKTHELEPDTPRALRINYSGTERDRVKSYQLRVTKILTAPEPKAIGNDKIIIIRHNLETTTPGHGDKQPTNLDLVIRNVSQSTVSTAIFEVLFYDIEGNIVETIKHRESGLLPNCSRAVHIRSSETESDIKSYDVRLTKTITADVEKFQITKNVLREVESGQEVSGIIKNISETKRDAALIMTFNDSKNESIGTKVIIFRDIEPQTVKQYLMIFKPQEGDAVASCGLNVAEIIE